MAKINSREIGLARIYAKSMLDLAEAQSEADSLRDELLELKKYLQANPQVGELFRTPTMDAELRGRFIENTLRGRTSDLLVDSLQVINRKDRLALFQEIVEQYRLAHEELRNMIDVFVQTAVPLDEALRAEIRTAAKNYSGKEPVLIEVVEPELLGGLIVTIGDMKFDGSVAMQLRRMAEKLAAVGAREITSGHSLVADLVA